MDVPSLMVVASSNMKIRKVRYEKRICNIVTEINMRNTDRL